MVAHFFAFSIFLLVAISAGSQTASDIVAPPGLETSQQEINYAEIWRLMSDTEKEALLLGIKTGLACSRLLLYYLEMRAEAVDGDKETAQGISDSRAILEAEFNPLPSNAELRLRMDLYYMKKPNRFDRFYTAVVDAILESQD